MFKLLKFIIILAIVGFLALVGFAYLGNLDPVQQDISTPIDLNG